MVLLGPVEPLRLTTGGIQLRMAMAYLLLLVVLEMVIG
jgi:hypothetical protein